MSQESLHYLASLNEELTHLDEMNKLSTRREIFLTGATGSLGYYLLAQLLEQTSARLHCLVRARSDEEALSRLHEAAEEYSSSALATHGGRVSAIAGDLSTPRFGLPEGAYDALARRADVIVHAAANTSFVSPFSASHPANVLGTRHVLEFTRHLRTKGLHYTSSCGVRLVDPQTSDERSIGLFNGYAKSKYVAEQMVARHASYGFPAVSYRIGYVYLSYPDFDSSDTLETLLRLFIEMGEAPILSAPIDFTPGQAVLDDIVQDIVESDYRRPLRMMHHPEPLDWQSIVLPSLQLVQPELKLFHLDDFLPRFVAFLRRYPKMKVQNMRLIFTSRFPEQAKQLFARSKTDLRRRPPEYCVESFAEVIRYIVANHEWS